jgi:hypothetical protein
MQCGHEDDATQRNKTMNKDATMMQCNETKQAMLQDATQCNKFMAIAIRGRHL